MKKLSLALLICCLAAQALFSAELTWGTDLAKAKAQAKDQNKLILIDFTGSDWCGWCKKFKADVLEQKEFVEFAHKQLILVELDYPSAKVPQSDDLKAVNKKLKEEYGVKGFPTFVVLDSAGKEIGRQVGYSQGGPKPFISKIEGFKK